MYVKECCDNANYLLTPTIERNEVKLLWASDYWDGPLSGMLEYKSQPYWFLLCAEGTDNCAEESSQESNSDWYRRFMVVELSTAQLQDEEYWHELFKQKVGMHMDYDQDENQHGVIVNSKEVESEFYEPYKKRTAPDLSETQVICWFEMA